MNYVLIDLENVQPHDLSLLRGHQFNVLVFVGTNQTKLKIEFVEEMQALGKDSKYVRISGTGRNALDFHIAFEFGRLAQAQPKGSFHIVSKDRGFDVLLDYARTLGVAATRVTSITEISVLRSKKTKSAKVKVEAIVENLKAQGSTRPRRVKTLRTTINNWFGKSLSDSEMDALVKQLEASGEITIDGQKVSYNMQ
jgi:hypothetical protein